MITIKRSVLVGVLLSSVGALASYYQQDFFPIGFTGFDHTGYWSPDSNFDGSPYPEYGGYEYGDWDKEKELLESTHCNFIGCSDALKRFDKNIILNYNPFKSQTI